MYHQHQELEDLKSEKRDLFSAWVQHDAHLNYMLHDYLTTALVVTDVEDMYEVLLQAQRIAATHDFNDLLNHTEGPYNTLLEWSGYEAFWNQSNRYLNQLLIDWTKNDKKHLSEVEKKSLNIINAHAEIGIKKLYRLKILIMNKSWDDIVNDREIKQEILDLKEQMESLPNIDYPNKEIEQINESSSLPFDHEQKYSEDELKHIAMNYMKDIWPDDATILTSGGGFSADYGEHVNFIVENHFYEITLSTAGGHVIFVRNTEFDDMDHEQESKITKKAAVFKAEEFLNQWKEENEQFEIANVRKERLGYSITMVPVRKGIIHDNREIKLMISGESGDLVQYNALMYFIHYGKLNTQEATISKEEAVKKINDDLEVIGPIELEVRYGRSGSDVLVYRIPVSGVSNITDIFINAHSGKYEGKVVERLEEV